MESLAPALQDLTSKVDDLESALSPILNAALSASTSKLPLLDKAKLYVLATYAIESILFSYLRLNGVDAKSHPVFQELTRVKEYFGKIKAAEDIGAGGRSLGAGRLDKDAAGRFVKHGLAGNDKYDRERKERTERERTGAKRKLEGMSVGTHTRFDGVGKRIKATGEDEGQTVNVVRASEADSEDGLEVVKEKRARRTKSTVGSEYAASGDGEETAKKKRQAKKQKKRERVSKEEEERATELK